MASLGQAKIHNEVRLDILRADCRQLGATATRDLIIPFVAMNFGPQDVYPQVEMPVPDPEDLEVLTKGVTSLVPFGLRVSEREMREKYGLSEPSDDELLLQAPAAAAPVEEEPDEKDPPKAKKGRVVALPARRAGKTAALAALSAAVADHTRSCRCRSCLVLLAADDPAIDDVDALFDAAMEEWEEVVDPITRPLAKILEEATSFEEALAMLEASGPDSSKLAMRLAELTAIARGIGDVKD